MKPGGRRFLPTVRVLILSDTHGQLHPAILALAREADRVVHAGDIGHPEVLERLAAPVVAVRGNNDVPGRWPGPAQPQLERLPLVAWLDLPGGRLVVEHGDRVLPAPRRHERLRMRHPAARLVVYGHSHRQLLDQSAAPWIVNPGAAGRSRTFGGSGCAVLTAGRKRWDVETYRFPLSSWC